MMKLTWSTHKYFDGSGDIVANVTLDATETEIDLRGKSMFAHDAQLVATVLLKCK